MLMQDPMGRSGPCMIPKADDNNKPTAQLEPREETQGTNGYEQRSQCGSYSTNK